MRFRAVLGTFLSQVILVIGGQEDEAGHFPNIPDVPLPEDLGIFVVYDNVSHVAASILDQDLVGPPLSDIDDEFVFDDDLGYNPEDDVDLFQGEHFEGDIFGVSVSSLPEFKKDGDELIVRNAVVNQFQKWPEGRVPYVISRSFSQRDRKVLLQAIRQFEARSCVHWEPRDRLRDQDYVHIIPDSGCYSQVGRTGSGAQILSLGKGCVNVGTAIHEMLHATGFWHEQSRPDRNGFISVAWGNIKSGYEDNFARYERGEVSTLELAYDTQSVMHYSSRAFTRNGQETIVPRQALTASLGQRRGFSRLDIEKLNRLYECPRKTTQTGGPECADVFTKGLCFTWFNQNGCFAHQAFMEVKCPKTCGFCEPLCVDKEDSCRNLALFKGQCEIDPDFMLQNCPKSCGVCHKLYLAKSHIGSFATNPGSDQLPLLGLVPFFLVSVFLLA
eukprot:maker-scaffold434_size172279-snap-gene-0.18 protein:Tk10094 transcript:maker-scaffold434_size172279-snap-gene-0.18-mRNA-1 annotation:"zinc metalloproteinase nas-15"